MKKTLILVCMVPFLLLLLGGYWLIGPKDKVFQESLASPSQKSFDELMGNKLPSWSLIRSNEDRENLAFFRQIFENQAKTSSKKKIPKIAHFIWIGPREFPQSSHQNVASWVKLHPDWKFYYWTDRDRPLPHPHMEVKKIDEFTWNCLADCFQKSDNYAEKADVLRYEILFSQGGVYIDHDVKCLQSFDHLMQQYDFFCGLELPSEGPLRSTVHVTNNLIATVPNHPILKYCLDWLPANWDRIQNMFPGEKKESIIARVANRTFFAFANGVRQFANQDSDMVFPAFYFNAPSDDQALYARHLYAGTWFENETPFEKMVRERMMMISKKNNKILLLVGVLCALNILVFVFLFLLVMNLKKTFSQSRKLLKEE